MEDYFALLDQPRRPWLDLEPIKDAFFSLSTHCHPDRFHNAGPEEKKQATDHYARLNQAYQCLTHTKPRLRHLLTLEGGHPPEVVQQVPEESMAMFLEVGQLCRDIDQFLTQKQEAASPMLRVQHFERGLQWLEKVQTLQHQVQSQQQALVPELQALGESWDNAPPIGSTDRINALPLQRLETLYRVFSHLERWAQQLQDRAVQLGQ